MKPIQMPRQSEDEVLLAFSVEPMHNRETLEKYLREYPEYKEALVQCSVELLLDQTRIQDTAQPMESIVEKAWQHFQATVSQLEAGANPNPFHALDRSAIKSLAASLNITTLLLVRLRDRTIIAETIPTAFIRRVAEELPSTMDAVMKYLQAPPQMVSNLSFRSDVKPAVTEQISFEQAVESSNLTLEQRNALEALRKLL